jgi:hypothetical protein
MRAEPVLLKMPAPVIGPLKIALLPAVVSIVAAPVTLNVRDVVSAPLAVRICPLTMVTELDASPNAASPTVVRTMPSVIVAPPVNVFGCVIETVPGPVLLKPLVPASGMLRKCPLNSVFHALIDGRLCRTSAGPVSVMTLVVLPAGRASA